MKIDEEFSSLIPPLSDEEYRGLEESILNEGCRDALIVWDDILIDGHNRYRICEAHGLPYQTVQKEFASRDEVKLWMIQNQLSRRNLTAFVRSELALKLKPLIAGMAKQKQGTRNDLFDIPQKSWECQEQKEIEKVKSLGLSYDAERNAIYQVKQDIARQRRNEANRKSAHIYFMRIDDKMKVGSSSDVETRLAQLKVASPTICLVADVLFGDGAKKHENALKKRFADYRINGEVYRYSDELLREMVQYTEREANRGQETDVIIAKAAGVSHDTIAKVEKIIQNVPEETKADLRAGNMSINQAYQHIRRIEKEARREEARQENAEKVQTISNPLEAQGLFQTIVIDPAWDYSEEGDNDAFGRIKPNYQTMSIDEIEALPIAKIADENCHLYIWVTNRTLQKSFRLMDAWGFRFITCLTWIKPHFGVGNYFRSQTEHVLFGVRGSQPLKRHDVGTWFEAPSREHSVKPDEFYKLVETCSYAPYIDIFGRKEREGWTVWGENS